MLRDFARALDRLAAGDEADVEKRRDLRQEIHLQIGRSLECYDNRCAVKTWVFRVAHNTAVSYVSRERRAHQRLVALEDMDPAGESAEPDIDRERAATQLAALVRRLKPLDRQIMIGCLEGMDSASIAGITGLSTANVGMKIHRIKQILARRFQEAKPHA